MLIFLIKECDYKLYFRSITDPQPPASPISSLPLTFEVVKQGSQLGRDLLVDSHGYTYVIKVCQNCGNKNIVLVRFVWHLNNILCLLRSYYSILLTTYLCTVFFILTATARLLHNMAVLRAQQETHMQCRRHREGRSLQDRRQRPRPSSTTRAGPSG